MLVHNLGEKKSLIMQHTGNKYMQTNTFGHPETPHGLNSHIQQELTFNRIVHVDEYAQTPNLT